MSPLLSYMKLFHCHADGRCLKKQKEKKKKLNKGDLKSVIAHYMLALAVSSMKKKQLEISYTKIRE